MTNKWNYNPEQLQHLQLVDFTNSLALDMQS